jgi:hypothetical protein
MNDADRATLAYLQSLCTERFWGFITLKFENGHLVHLRREENIKPSNIPTTSSPERTRNLPHNVFDPSSK